MRPFRVLLVEDDAVFAKLLQMQIGAFDAAGYAVTRVASLAAARDRLAAEAFDIVLTDMGLPDSHGPPTVDALEALARGAPIVVLSGSDEAPPGRAFLRKGGITVDEVGQALQRATRGAR